MKNELVEPADSPPPRQVALDEIGRWAPTTHTPWLADAVMSLAELPDTNVQDEERLLRCLNQACMGMAESFERGIRSEDEALLHALIHLPRNWMYDHPRKLSGDENYLHYDRVLAHLLPFWEKNWRSENWTDTFRAVWTLTRAASSGSPPSSQSLANTPSAAGTDSVDPEKTR